MDEKWYYAEGERPIGPISRAELGVILSHLSNPGEVLVWTDGLSTWTNASNVSGLAAFVIKPPPLPLRRPTPPSAIVPQIQSTDTGPAANISEQLHPWRRYFARIIDLYIFMLLFFLLLGVLFPEMFDSTQSSAKSGGSDYLYGLLALAVYSVFETICLNIFGTTFGKFLYRIQLKTKEGGPLSFSNALKRSLAVWARGLGLGLPLISLVTLIVAYQTLHKEKEASWDRDFQCTIIHHDLSVLRWLTIAVAWLVFLAVYVLLTAIGSGRSPTF